MAQPRPRRQLGARIRSLREARKWSQEQLAVRCGLHRTYVGGVERGERNISLDNIVRIATSMGVSASELLKGVGDGR